MAEASSPQSEIALLQQKARSRWPAIARARKAAASTQAKISKLLNDRTIFSTDYSIVVFGSLARGEWTVGSDVDWTMLVDGRGDPSHIKTARMVGKRLEDADFKKPGQGGVFGTMAFSHDIIHNIGGDRDTNQNTTRRVLLLLESCSIGGDEARERVVKTVLNQYTEDELAFVSPQTPRHKVCRFLLNDFVRFWRTMAVDYASKKRDRDSKGWAIRNIKLRLSRKLIFCSGLLMCFRPLIENRSVGKKPMRDPYLQALLKLSALPPLEALASGLNRMGKPGTARTIFGAYNRFLDFMNDGPARKRLEKLPPDRAGTDKEFSKLRDISHQFDKGLLKFFFDDDPQLGTLVRKYGVF